MAGAAKGRPEALHRLPGPGPLTRPNPAQTPCCGSANRTRHAMPIAGTVTARLCQCRGLRNTGQTELRVVCGRRGGGLGRVWAGILSPQSMNAADPETLSRAWPSLSST